MAEESQRTSKIGVVLPVYNGAAYLDSAIQSALNQTLPPCEIAITDDGSTDNTAQIIDKYKSHPLVRVQRLEQRVIAPIAWNRAIRFAQSPYFVILAHDDLILPTFIERTQKVLDAEPGIEFITTGYRVINESGAVTAERPAPLPQLIGRVKFGDFFDELVNGGGMHFCDTASVVARTVFEKINGFDERFRGGVYDWDFYLRLAFVTSTFGIADCLADYRVHATNMSADLHRDDKGDADIVFGKLDAYPFTDAQRRAIVRNLSNFQFQHYSRAIRAAQLSVPQVQEAREKILNRLKNWSYSGGRFAPDVRLSPSRFQARLAWSMGSTGLGIRLLRLLIGLFSRKQSRWS